MRPAVFLDTSAWFAALNEHEDRHAQAAAYYRQAIAQGGFSLVTTNLVLAEMYALLRRRQGARPAIAFLDRVHEDPRHDVVWVTRDLARRAVDRWLRPFSDHRFSLTDAVGFEVMHERGLTTAFATDGHFTIAGFETVPAP
ncbi:MAG: type II toxin-antitoxin system VapC family toxin [Gemmatimonadales bacterium]